MQQTRVHLKTVNLSDRSLYSELSCCWVEPSLHPWTSTSLSPTYPRLIFLQQFLQK
ncbi:hypothetical protein CKA32_006100 [Geitlerinema sp. FC II]|nr:hypothetical protein CKA32_006688 [Geitlerinema sp. FC II]PPT08211.1 hypothetical protein CKA32_006100 [Geitlerinema sp. FC II]